MAHHLAITVVSDLYQPARTEDGEAFTAEVYCVQAEAPDGRRWAHRRPYYGCQTHFEPEDGITRFEDVREGAKAAAEALAARVVAHLAAGGKLHLAHWNEVQPCYGSAAYQAGGWEEAQIAHEKRRDREGD